MGLINWLRKKLVGEADPNPSSGEPLTEEEREKLLNDLGYDPDGGEPDPPPKRVRGGSQR